MREVTGSSPVSSTKKSLLEPLSKSKVSGEDFFYLFLKSGRWGVRVNQKRMFCRIVPGFFSFLGNEDYCFSRNLSPKRWEGEIRIVHDLHNVLTNEISSLILFILIIITFREGLIIMAYYDAEHKAIIEKFNAQWSGLNTIEALAAQYDIEDIAQDNNLNPIDGLTEAIAKIPNHAD